MKNKTLGTLALLGAPSMYLGFYLEGLFNLSNSWFTGIWGLLFITSWMCSIFALQRMRATGQCKFGKGILRVILGTLILANTSNVYQLLLPKDKSVLFLTLDAFWPISNLIMFVIGITVVANKGLSSWRRYVPLAVGLWFPFAMLSKVLLGTWDTGFQLVGLYSALAWSLLALLVMTSKQTNAQIESSDGLNVCSIFSY